MRRQDNSLGQSDQRQNFLQNTPKFHEKLGYQISTFHTTTDDLIQEELKGSFNSHLLGELSTFPTPLRVPMFPTGGYQRLRKYKVFIACFHKPKIPFLSYCSHVYLHCDTATHSAYSLKPTAKTLRGLCEAISSVLAVLPERRLCKASIWPLMSEFSHLWCWTL